MLVLVETEDDPSIDISRWVRACSVVELFEITAAVLSWDTMGHALRPDGPKGISLLAHKVFIPSSKIIPGVDTDKGSPVDLR